MARNTSSITKQSRREGYALHPKALRIMVRRATIPGQHGRSRQGKPSQYAIQLREKQKVRRIYGVMEKQFRKLLDQASAMPGQSGANLLVLLESRLDNTVYRAGFAPSRQAARQLVTHGHFVLNGTRVDIPSIAVKPGDEITLREKSKNNEYFKNIDQITDIVEQPSLSWLKADKKKFTIKVTSAPLREEAEPEINEQLIVEFYSR